MFTATWRSKLGTIIWVTLLVLSILALWRGPQFARSYHLKRLDTIALGVLDRVEEVEGIVQTEVGSMLGIMSYRVYYQYALDGTVEDRMEIVPTASLADVQFRFLKSLSPGDTILLMTSAKYPSIARVWLGD
ncbi:MAG: hypothetical protein AAGH79_09200 [Bacteroidota bacterium]